MVGGGEGSETSGVVQQMRRAKPSLVEQQLSHDTIECLERLLSEARAGRVIGIAFAALLKRRHYITHACGAAHQERVFTRGALRELDDQLGRVT